MGLAFGKRGGKTQSATKRLTKHRHRVRLAPRASVRARRGSGETISRPGRFVISPARCRSEEHTSELQSLMRISYAVFCLKKKTNQTTACHPHIQYTHE